jgi:hypothetical protein
MIIDINVLVRYDDILESDRYPLKSILNIDHHTVQDDFGENVRILHSTRLFFIEIDGVWYSCISDEEGLNDDLKSTRVNDTIYFQLDTDKLKQRSIKNIGEFIRRRE